MATLAAISQAGAAVALHVPRSAATALPQRRGGGAVAAEQLRWRHAALG